MEGSIEAQIGYLLRQRGWRLALGESCTGGLLGHRLTSVPGASSYFAGGITSYSDRVKSSLLGVDRGTLEEHGAVSEATAIEMAQGARRAFGVEVGLSVTGIAGPGGGTATKPVGLTWIAVSTPDRTRAEEHRWEGDRAANKERSAQAALTLLASNLRGESDPV